MTTALENLEALAKALDDWPVGPPALQVDDIHEQYKHLLTPEALAALEPPKKTTVYLVHHADRLADYTRAIYLTGIARSEAGIEKVATALYGEVNKLAQAGKLCGHLCRLSMVVLADHAIDLHEYVYPDGKPKAYAIFVFPHVPAEWAVQGIQYETEEGAIGHDFEPELKPPETTHSPTCWFCRARQDPLDRPIDPTLFDDET
jgi:hypothetical protein